MERKTFVRIPRDRVGVLVGPGGSVKSRIEKTFRLRLDIDSGTGNVDIVLAQNHPDVSVAFTTANIVKAVGRGFNPDRALLLANENWDLTVIDLEELVGTSEQAQGRVRGRIIGKEGKSRALIEELTETQMSVYGSTVAIIGAVEALPAAREAVMMLVRGSFHKTVWNYLYSYRRQLKREKGELWYDQPPRPEELKEKPIPVNSGEAEDTDDEEEEEEP